MCRTMQVWGSKNFRILRNLISYLWCGRIAGLRGICTRNDQFPPSIAWRNSGVRPVAVSNQKRWSAIMNNSFLLVLKMGVFYISQFNGWISRRFNAPKRMLNDSLIYSKPLSKLSRNKLINNFVFDSLDQCHLSFKGFNSSIRASSSSQKSLPC